MFFKERVKKRRVIIFGLLGLVLILSVFLSYNFLVTANKTKSPTNEYEAYYNRITKTITLHQLSTGAKWQERECYSPVFLWSPDGKYLARNISSPHGNRRAEIRDLEHSVVYTTLTKSNIQEMYEETRTHNQSTDECIEITKWLDNRHVLLEFLWDSDIPGESITGWCIYDFLSRTIIYLALSE